MIMLPPTVRAFLCTRPTDMRKGFDGLSGLVRGCFGQDLLSGHLFLFVNRRGNRLKILYFDRDGLALWYKKQEEQYPHRSRSHRSRSQARNTEVEGRSRSQK